MNEKKPILALGVVAGIGGVILFATFLEVHATAQHQTTTADPQHANNNSNQSGRGITEQQQQHNTTALSGMVVMNQTFNTSWLSLVSDVNVTGISIIDNDHTAVNLHHYGEGVPPGVSVVAVVTITNSSSGTIIGSMMHQQDSIMIGRQEAIVIGMLMANNQQSNSSADQESQQHQQQHLQNSTSPTNSSARILSSMQSGSNYLEAGWLGQESSSTTVLVQLDGDIPEGAHIMVIIFPFLHH